MIAHVANNLKESKQDKDYRMNDVDIENKSFQQTESHIGE